MYNCLYVNVKVIQVAMYTYHFLELFYAVSQILHTILYGITIQ